jgi:hypothetical protein
MTDEELKAVIAKTAAMVHETTNQMRETDRKMDRLSKETDRKMQETDRKIDRLAEQISGVSKHTNDMSDKTDRKIAALAEQISGASKHTNDMSDKTDRKIDKLAEQIGGIDNNIGYHAEQFFQDVLSENKVFGGITYDEVIPNMKHGNEVEFDIFLKNCNSVAIIEIKNRIHQGFVKKMAEERLGKFRKYFPEYKDCDAYLGIAGFSFSEKVLSEAKKYGIGIIKQVGEGIEVKTDGLKAYR